jgi:endonuclease-3
LAQIENEIRIAGLAKQKARTIKELLEYLKKINGEADINYLKHHSSIEIINELTNLKGIGVKTAACVLLFSLGRNVCPVDTHVHRILNRIGLVKTTQPQKTFFAINDFLEDGIAHQLHTNLLRLGREICKPLKPNCMVCPLEKICKYKDKIYEAKKISMENKFMLLDNI